MQGGTPVLEELWDVNGPKRCAIVEKAPTGSYQATLSWIGLSYIGFEGFLFGLVLSGALFGSRWYSVVLIGARWYSLLLVGTPRCWYSLLVLAAGTRCWYSLLVLSASAYWCAG